MTTLYDALELPKTAPLIAVTSAGADITNDVRSVSITRGGTDLSAHQPATCTITTRGIQNIALGSNVTVALAANLAAKAAAWSQATTSAIATRFVGRGGGQSYTDTGRGRDHDETQLLAAAWSGVLANAPTTWQPAANALIADGRSAVVPQWAPFTIQWFGDSDRFPATPPEPLTSGDWLQLVQDRLYLPADLRNGDIRIKALNAVVADSAAAVETKWPLSRWHCQAPATWELSSAMPSEFELRRVGASGGTSVIITGEQGLPDGQVKLTQLDWTNTVSITDQWQRVYGLRRDSLGVWTVPTITVRMDQLITSPFEDARRVAGMVAALEVSDPVPLAGDWPAAVQGIHICTGIQETITPTTWTITVSLVPYLFLSDDWTSPPVKARTWNQALGGWDDQTTTWNEGTAS